MTTLALLVRGPKRVKIGFTDELEEDDVQIDFLEAESHNWDVAITRHPVEKGASIIDHIQPQPRRCVITGAVSDISLNLFEFATSLNPYSDSKIVTMIDFLSELYSSQRLVSLATRYQRYASMAVTNIAWERNARTGEKVPYQITFEEVRLVTSIVAPAISPAKDLTGAPKAKGVGSATADAGKKAPVQAPVDPLANGSVATQLLGVGL